MRSTAETQASLHTGSSWQRRAWRRLRHWQFRLFQQHRHDRLVLEQVADHPLLVLPGVMNPKLFRTGEFMAQCLDRRLIPPGCTVLDMGTGSGVGAVFAARWAARVVAVDINPEAVRCARINALLNQAADRIKVRHGDLFAPVGNERFDVILFNPPYLNGEPRSALEQALWSADTVERFAAGLGAHLAPAGHALVLLSTDADLTGILKLFHSRGLAVEPVAKRDLRSEVLILYRAQVEGSRC